jgi:hypothetical protein
MHYIAEIGLSSERLFAKRRHHITIDEMTCLKANWSGLHIQSTVKAWPTLPHGMSSHTLIIVLQQNLQELYLSSFSTHNRCHIHNSNFLLHISFNSNTTSCIHSNTNLQLTKYCYSNYMHYHYFEKMKPHTVPATSYISFNGTFSCFQCIGFTDRMIGQYRREQDLQLHSYGLVQYTVLEILTQTAHNQETNSSQHGPYPGLSLVRALRFSIQQTSN